MSQHDHRADGSNGIGMVLIGLFFIGAAIAVVNVEWAAIYGAVLPVVALPLLSIDAHILQPRLGAQVSTRDATPVDG